MNLTASLYVHIPFCSSFCDYCDFYSIKIKDVNDSIMDEYVNSVIKDIKNQIEYFKVSEIVTAYIGGGTPSVLGAKRLAVLFEALKEIPAFTPKEFSIEANPESADEDFLSVCKEGGVNRISIGVQSFHEPSRLAVSRGGKTGKLKEQFALVSRFFPNAFSADLITGLPYQTEKIVLDDIKYLLDFNPAHISLYSLAVEDETPLYQKIKIKTVVMPNEDLSSSLWLAGRDALLDAGFEHYEISNFAKNGNKCLHNIRYWNMESWLGAGPAASGTVLKTNALGFIEQALRFTYAPDLQAYLDAPSIHTALRENLDRTALIKENLLMGYRLKEGLDVEKFKARFGAAVEDCIGETLAHWKGRDKMLFLNSFLLEAFAELELRKL